MGSILEVKNLSKSFKDFQLKNLSFSCERGFIMGFIGPNGAGKSTTIKLIMNLLKRDGGEIRIFGEDNIKKEKEIKNKIGFVYDENHYYEELTIGGMKSVVSPFYKNWDEDCYKKYIKEFGLSEKKKIKELSKGMKMKFSLCIALSHRAELLILDEPTSGLDPVVRSELLEILSYIMQDENKAIFFSTHITSDLDKVADYITLINNGELLLSAEKDEIVENHCIVKGALDILDKDIKREFVGLKENSFGFEALASNRNKIVKLFGNKVIIEKPSLEDVMLFHTKNRIGGTQYV